MCGHCLESQPLCQAKSAEAALEHVLTLRAQADPRPIDLPPFRVHKERAALLRGNAFFTRNLPSVGLSGLC
jgi:hypothetical protein